MTRTRPIDGALDEISRLRAANAELQAQINDAGSMTYGAARQEVLRETQRDLRDERAEHERTREKLAAARADAALARQACVDGSAGLRETISRLQLRCDAGRVRAEKAEAECEQLRAEAARLRKALNADIDRELDDDELGRVRPILVALWPGAADGTAADGTAAELAQLTAEALAAFRASADAYARRAEAVVPERLDDIGPEQAAEPGRLRRVLTWLGVLASVLVVGGLIFAVVGPVGYATAVALRGLV